MSRCAPSPRCWRLWGVLLLCPWTTALAGDSTVLKPGSAWYQHRSCVQTGGRMAVALSGDGQWVAAQRVDAQPDPPREQLYALSGDLNWPAELACLPAMRRQLPDDNGLTITALSMSRDGRVIAVGGRGRPVQMWKRRQDRWIREAAVLPAGSGRRIPAGWGTAVALSGDGRLLVVADEDGRTGGLEGAIRTAERRPDGSWGPASTLTWSGMPLRGRLGPSLALSADGQTLAVGLFEQEDQVLLLRRDAGSWRPLASVVQPLTQDRLAVELALAADGRWLAVGSGGPGADDVGRDLPPGELALFEVTPQAARLRGRWQSPQASDADHFAQRLRFDRAGHVWALDPGRGRVCRYPLPHSSDPVHCAGHVEAPKGQWVQPIPVEDFDVSDDGQRVLLGVTSDPSQGLLVMLGRR